MLPGCKACRRLTFNGNKQHQLWVLVRFQQDLKLLPSVSGHKWDRESWCCLSFSNFHPLGQRTRNASYHCFSLKIKQNLLKEQFWKIHNKSLVLKIDVFLQPLNQSPTSSWKKTKIINYPWGQREIDHAKP